MYHWLLGGSAPGPPTLSVNTNRATPSAWWGSPVQSLRTSVAGTGDVFGAVSSVSSATSTPGEVHVSTTSMTVVEALFSGLGSGRCEETVARFVRVAGVDGAVTTIVTVALAPRLMVPSLQVTVAVPEHLPRVVVTETNDAVPGSVSVSVAPVVLSGPLLT